MGNTGRIHWNSFNTTADQTQLVSLLAVGKNAQKKKKKKKNFNNFA